jgi:hypothetical protein
MLPLLLLLVQGPAHPAASSPLLQQLHLAAAAT